MNLTFQPALVASGEDGEARLVWRDDYLVAVLVRLSSAQGEMAGHWFLEKGFGSLDAPNPPAFFDLDTAESWIRERLADGFGGRYWP
ncbi:hypothetical protein [Phenylobacterium sp.]|uniref:hypothetical protein n=1 Tax=Phenylobacterium sp. TaxID=1871053 RepID=UPI0035B0DEEF